MKRIHVDENVTIRTNEEADIAFLTENDIAYYDEKKGIAKVPKERWEKAQRTERKHWMEIGKDSKDDRNFYHLQKFDYYKSIKNKLFKHALEVGCGPFTNLRIIANQTIIKKCSLTDPLINDYLTHENCSYTKKRLSLSKNQNSSKSFFNKVFGKNLIIDKLYPTAFEEIETNQKFDLIVIINVIEHCYDIDLFFNKVLYLLDEKGILVFEDKLFATEKVREEVNLIYDAAHPLKVNEGLIKSFLDKNFYTKYSSIISNDADIEGNILEWNDIYFVGEKK